MPKRTNILVVGGYDQEDDSRTAPPQEIIAFSRALGYEVIDHGHNLLSGCQTDLDRVVAEAAGSHPSLAVRSAQNSRRIVSYVLDGKPQAHDIGTIMGSSRKDWDLGSANPGPPEVIQAADVVILVGGFYGTFSAANWARIQRLPLLPFFRFGGAARTVYEAERSRLEDTYPLDAVDYDRVLKSVTKEWDLLAHDTVQLAERLSSSKAVLICMSFANDPGLGDLLETIRIVCEEFGYVAERIDESNLQDRVVPQILNQVKRSAFVVVDITEPRPNVYYELGFADGAGKDIVITARKGTQLPFNIADVPVIFWDSFKNLKDDLRKRVALLASFDGLA